MNGLALCAGVGGLELGIERVFPSYRTLVFVEGEAFAASNLVKKMEEGRLAQAAIWSDVRSFDGRKLRGKVDIISAGFPCQPFSKAGSLRGKADDRHLWPEISRIIGQVEPSIIILENVPNVLEIAGAAIFGDIAEMGYDLAWGIVRASDAGAPHRRARFFAVAIRSDSDMYGHQKRRAAKDPQRIIGEGELEGGRPSGICANVPDSNHDSRGKGPSQRTDRELSSKSPRLEGWKDERKTWHESWSGGSNVSNPNRDGQSDLPFNAREGRIFQQSEHWKVEPRVGRMVDGVADWVDRLRACGNGVVPQQAELAIRILLNTLIERKHDLNRVQPSKP